MNKFEERLESLLLKYKNATHDDYGVWDVELDKCLEDLFQEDCNEFIKAVKYCIFKLDPNMGSIDMLFEHTLRSEKFAGTGINNLLFEILDNHPTKNIRNNALLALQASRYNEESVLHKLEDRYENINIKKEVAVVILGRLLKINGVKDYYGISKNLLNGNVDKFDEIIKKESLEKQSYIFILLKESKYIPTEIKSVLKQHIKSYGDAS